MCRATLVSKIGTYLFITILLVSLSGCWDAPSLSVESPTAKANTPVGRIGTKAPDTETTLSVKAPPQGVLRLFGAEPLTLDPAVAQDAGSWTYLLQIYGGLVSLNDKLEIVPELAKDWQIDSSGRVYTFHLQPDARFHDGKPVTASDLKYSLERAADPGTESSTASIYLGDIEGVHQKLVSQAKEVSGIKVIDEHILEITIDGPKPYFLAKLSYPTAYVVDRRNVESGSRWWERPNGTGPFQLKEWKRETQILLEANLEFYGNRPKIAQVSYFFGGGSSMAMYEKGQLDIAEVGQADIERVTDPDSPLNKELAVTEQLSLWYIGFNTEMKPFDDPLVRQAFAYATDRQRIVDILLQKSRAKANGILPPGMPGHDSSFAGNSFDPIRAKALLSQSSYGSADKLPTITFTTGAGGSGLAERFAEMYRRNLGVEINVEQADRTFFADLEQRNYQMFYLGWVADYPDPQDFLDILFHSRSEGNHSAFADQEIDRLLEQARAEANQQKRWQLYRDAERQIVAQAPVIPMFHDVDYVLVKPWVHGLTWTPIGVVSLRDVRVD